MSSFSHSIQPGHVFRHAQKPDGIPVEIAVLDIAQDFLLTHLHNEGFFDEFVHFKGGTCLRKFFAGAEGRFSTDLDFALAHPQLSKDKDEVADLLSETLDRELGPFTFSRFDNGGRWHLGVESIIDVDDPEVSVRLDVGPPTWLSPQNQSFEDNSIHKQYEFDLPDIPCMAQEEIIAEKVARFNHVSSPRDAWDLVWMATNSPHSNFDREQVKELAILKIWVDNNGLGNIWEPGNSPRPYEINRWFSSREGRWRATNIGRLAGESASLDEIEQQLFSLYGFLRDLADEQETIASANEGDRSLIIQKVEALNDRGFTSEDFW